MLYEAQDWGRGVATRREGDLDTDENLQLVGAASIALRLIPSWTSGRGAVKAELGARAYADEVKNGVSSGDRSAPCFGTHE